ncbi:MAG TPA: tetratricopeptide repeat protein [Thermoanaerobaculia bacterium]|nr:tetratricopeptide repeat protein [Thermoanaerobaculia bacterium]
MPLEPGSRLGTFEVLSRLGAGGMGEVFRARDTRLQREVAIKVLPEAFAEDEDRLQRFTREAHVLASLNHPNIAAIYSFEEVDGLRFLVLELVSGETLKQRIARAPVSVNEAIRFGLQIADALEAAHAKGVLHRDLKPTNVNVTPEGKLKLLDFGLAKAFGIGAASPDISHSPTIAADPTHQGVVLGTASYMSPEQARSRALDGRSDLWAFGCVLYEMLAGKKAFDGESVSDILVAILDRDPDWAALPAATPAPLLDLMQRLLQKDPNGRPSSVAGTRPFLEAAAGSRTTAVFPVSGRSSRSASLARRGGPKAMLAAGAVLLVAGVGLLWLAVRERSGTALPASKLLAILPATDLTGRPDGRQLCDGVSFSLGVKLQNMAIPNLAITRPSSAAMLKETDPAKWARDTGANLLVQPAVRQMGETRELSFSISFAGSPIQIAAGEVSGPAAEHFRLEEELAQKLVSSLRLHLAAGGAVPTPAPSSVPAGAPQTDTIVALGYLERYDDEASVERAIDLLKKIPGGESSAVVQAALGRAYLAAYQNTHDVAFPALARTSAEAAQKIDPARFETLLTLGRSKAVSGRFDEAIEDFRRALARDPASVEALLFLGDALADSGKPEGAEAAYREAAAARPSSWAPQNRLGVFLYLRGDYARAITAWEEAARLNPTSPRPVSNLCGAYLQTGRLDDAVRAAQKSIELQGQPNSSGWSNLGTSYFYKGRYAEAAAAFEKAVAAAPKKSTPWIGLGDAALRAGSAARAHEAYEEALRQAAGELSVNPRDVNALRNKARALRNLGREEQARETILRARAAAPDDSAVLVEAARLAFLRQDRSTAFALLAEAVRRGFSPFLLKADPEFGEVRADPRFEKALSTARAKGSE